VSWSTSIWIIICVSLVFEQSAVRQQPNTRLKLTAPVVYCRIAFVSVLVRRRSLGAIR